MSGKEFSNDRLFGGCLTRSAGASALTLIGIADDSQSSYLRGSAKAPRAILRAYDGSCFNSSTEEGRDLAGLVYDGGILEPVGGFAESARYYRSELEGILKEGRVPFIMGGDHAVTIPAVEALRVLGQPVRVVQVDAHPDLHPVFEGDPLSHACTASRILEMEHVVSLLQIGIRSWTPPQRKLAGRYPERLRVVTAREWEGRIREEWLAGEDPIYLTVDLDGFDPAFAPGVSHPVPGGLTAREGLNLIRGLNKPLAGMDVVEVNPLRDVNNRTAILAARMLHEGMGMSLDGAAQPGD